MPMMSRMMKSIGRRMGMKSASMLTNHAERPITVQTFPITRRRTCAPRLRASSRAKSTSAASPAGAASARGSSSAGLGNRGLRPRRRASSVRWRSPMPAADGPSCRTMRLRVFSIMRPISARLSAASSLRSSMVLSVFRSLCGVAFYLSFECVSRACEPDEDRHGELNQVAVRVDIDPRFADDAEGNRQ